MRFQECPQRVAIFAERDALLSSIQLPIALRHWRVTSAAVGTGCHLRCALCPVSFEPQPIAHQAYDQRSASALASCASILRLCVCFLMLRCSLPLTPIHADVRSIAITHTPSRAVLHRDLATSGQQRRCSRRHLGATECSDACSSHCLTTASSSSAATESGQTVSLAHRVRGCIQRQQRRG